MRFKREQLTEKLKQLELLGQIHQDQGIIPRDELEKLNEEYQLAQLRLPKKEANESKLI